MGLFEKASRLKLRFPSNKGALAVEDLWDLPLTSPTGKVNLDDIARTIYRQVKETGDDISFVTPAQKVDEIPQLQLEIVKHIITVRLAERDVLAQAALKREEKQKLLALIANKKNEVLAGKSLEELQAMVDRL